MSTRLTRADLLNPRLAARMTEADRKALDVPDPAKAGAKADARRESELQRDCERELTRRGIEFLHLSPRSREKTGWPDLTFAIPEPGSEFSPVWRLGTPMAIELKTAGGRLSQEQELCLAAMQRNGWYVRVVRTFEDFRRVLAGDTAAGERV